MRNPSWLFRVWSWKRCPIAPTTWPETNGHKIVVTIEADTVDDSHDIASGFIGIEGVTGINLVYANFEDDPTLAEAGTR